MKPSQRQTEDGSRFVRVSADGGDRTHTSDEGNWILSPARLPVPPRRLQVKTELVIRLEGNASANDLRIAHGKTAGGPPADSPMICETDYYISACGTVSAACRP